jgi:hypothetical protein
MAQTSPSFQVQEKSRNTGSGPKGSPQEEGPKASFAQISQWRLCTRTFCWENIGGIIGIAGKQGKGNGKAGNMDSFSLFQFKIYNKIIKITLNIK